MPAIGWVTVPLSGLLALTVVVIAMRPDAGSAVAAVVKAMEGPLQAIVPWGRRRGDETPDAEQRDEDRSQ